MPRLPPSGLDCLTLLLLLSVSSPIARQFLLAGFFWAISRKAPTDDKSGIGATKTGRDPVGDDLAAIVQTATGALIPGWH
jgi:hypothetical protein